jgi:hypothetical protein
VAECTTDEFESLECWIVGGGFGEVIQNPPFSKGEKGRPPEIRLVVGRAKWGGVGESFAQKFTIRRGAGPVKARRLHRLGSWAGLHGHGYQ